MEHIRNIKSKSNTERFNTDALASDRTLPAQDRHALDKVRATGRAGPALRGRLAQRPHPAPADRGAGRGIHEKLSGEHACSLIPQPNARCLKPCGAWVSRGAAHG